MKKALIKKKKKKIKRAEESSIWKRYSEDIKDITQALCFTRTQFINI